MGKRRSFVVLFLRKSKHIKRAISEAQARGTRLRFITEITQEISPTLKKL